MESVFHNCLGVEKTELGWFPYRFPKGQREAYEALGERPGIRSRCTAGITMEFLTDAPEVSFGYRALSFSRPFVCFSVYENGVLRQVFREPDDSQAGRIVYRRQEPGISRLTVYLPSLQEIVITDLQAGSYVACEEPKNLKILFLGDSITQGMVEQTASLSYTSRLGRYYGAETLNQAIGGEIFRAETLWETPGFAPDFLIVAFGINDASRVGSLPEVAANAERYFKKLRALFPDVPGAVITPIWHDCHGDEELARCLEGVRKIAAERGNAWDYQTVDGLSLVPHLPEFYQDADTHPNDAGFAEFSLNLIRQLPL